MDIAPLYELRARLRAAAISGTELLGEDFRLKRAVEGLKPLEAAAPVLARISQMAEKLLAADCADREGCLLETISLVDAVLCTQAQVAVKGEWEPIQTSHWGRVVSDVPYSLLGTLTDALTASGSGKFSYVTQLHETRPELFADYRVKIAMVRALGAGYAELADQVAQWLQEEGTELLPLLEKDFDPRGKKEMVRRVRVMEEIGRRKGLEEHVQTFFRRQLPEAQKDVRGALIYALRHDPGNGPFLMELTKTEKGSCRKMAFWALASMEGEAVAEFWKTQAAKKPEEMIPFLAASSSEWASRLVSEGFLAGLAQCAAPGQTTLQREAANQVLMYLKVLPGKMGPGVVKCYRAAIAAGTGLDKPLEGEKNVWELTGLGGFDWQQKLKFSLAIPICIQEALCWPHDRQLESYAAGLFAQEKENPEYFAPAMTAHMLMDEPDAFCRWLDAQMWKRVLLEKKLRKELFPQLYRVGISMIRDPGGQYWLRGVRVSPADGRREEFLQKLAQPVESYLVPLFFQCADRKLDSVLMKWIPGKEENSSYKDALLRYFSDRALTGADNYEYLRPLKQLGAVSCKGYAVKYFSVRGKAYLWELQGYLEQLPGSYGARAEEAEAVLKLIKQGRIRLLSSSPDRLEEYIVQLRHR